MSKFINIISNLFTMNFFTALSADKIYGIIKNFKKWKLAKFYSILASYIQREKISLYEIRVLVIALDNANIHTTQNEMKFITDSNKPMITIPPYVPSLNPVEKIILAIKYKLRQRMLKGQ